MLGSLFFENGMAKIVPATFYQRAAAWSLDALPFQVAFVLLLPPLPDLASGISAPTIAQAQSYVHGVFWAGTLMFTLYTIYHLVMEKNFSSTLGKFAVGLEVVYQQLSWSKVVARFLGCSLSWLMLNIGHLMILKKTYALHDQMTHTQVVYDPNFAFGNTPALAPHIHKLAQVVGLCWLGVSALISVVSVCLSVVEMIERLPI